MTFRVDDRFYGSDPVIRIPRRERLAVVGLWTLTGAWSKAFGKDGYVPEHIVDELGGTEAQAARLVEVGLWKVRRGGGWMFVDWSKWQETREQADKRKADAVARQQRRRAKIAEKPEDDHDGVTRDTTPRHPLSSPVHRPGPVPTPDDDLSSGGNSRTRAPAPDDGPSYPHGESGVDDDVASRSGLNLERIAAVLAERTRLEVHPIQARGAADHYIERMDGYPRMPTRYVVRCINLDDEHVLTNYIHTGRWSA